MQVKVERCWGGNNKYYFRLTFNKGRHGGHEFVMGEEWTREVATEALNIAEHNYGLKRKNVRFVRK